MSLTRIVALSTLSLIAAEAGRLPEAQELMQAARDNEFGALLELLDPDAAIRPDAAALAMGGQARTVSGQRAVAEFFAGAAKAALPATLDGTAASCWQLKGEIKVVFGFTVVDGRVLEIEVLADPSVVRRAARRSLPRA